MKSQILFGTLQEAYSTHVSSNVQYSRRSTGVLAPEGVLGHDSCSRVFPLLSRKEFFWFLNFFLKKIWHPKTGISFIIHAIAMRGQYTCVMHSVFVLCVVFPKIWCAITVKQY